MSKLLSFKERSLAKVLKFKSKKAKKKLKISEFLSENQRNKLILDSRIQAQKISRSILRKWNCKLPLEELDSIVDLSLCEAARKFNPDKGVSFITFLFYYLRGNLIKTVKELSAIQSTPVDIRDENLESGTIGDFTINPADVFELFGGKADRTLFESTTDKQLYEIATQVCKETLSPFEREVLFNIYIQEEQITELAKKMNYSRCHISRLKSEIINKLRNEMSLLTGEEIETNEQISKLSKLGSNIKPKRNNLVKLKRVA